MHRLKIYKTVKNYKVLIIDKISIINNKLFNFVNKLLTRVRQNNYFFKKIYVIVFENLMQLLSVKNR